MTPVADVTVREAQPDELHRCALIATEAGAPDAGAAAAAADVVFVAQTGRHLAGFAALRRAPGALVVEQLVVAVTDEGRGVGNRLLDWIEGYGVSLGMDRVRIAVEDGNRVAR